jgi:hypothetical protein
MQELFSKSLFTSVQNYVPVLLVNDAGIGRKNVKFTVYIGFTKM